MHAFEIAIASSSPGGGVSNNSPSFSSPNCSKCKKPQVKVREQKSIIQSYPTYKKMLTTYIQSTKKFISFKPLQHN